MRVSDSSSGRKGAGVGGSWGLFHAPRQEGQGGETGRGSLGCGDGKEGSLKFHKAAAVLEMLAKKQEIKKKHSVNRSGLRAQL